MYALVTHADPHLGALIWFSCVNIFVICCYPTRTNGTVYVFSTLLHSTMKGSTRGCMNQILCWYAVNFRMEQNYIQRQHSHLAVTNNAAVSQRSKLIIHLKTISNVINGVSLVPFEKGCTSEQSFHHSVGTCAHAVTNCAMCVGEGPQPKFASVHY